MNGLNPPEFDAFVNHFCACKYCRPRHNKYCVEGRELWINNQAAFIADLEKLSDRKYWIAQTQKMSPHYVERIKKAVVDKFKARLN